MTDRDMKGALTAPELPYHLEGQIGFLLRRATQRHTAIFTDLIPRDLTPTRFAALAKLYELGPLSQNRLGRLTSMDVANIKGVVDRLRDRGLVITAPDPNDGRRQIVSLTDKGGELLASAIPRAVNITDKTLDPLSKAERKSLLTLLKKIS